MSFILIQKLHVTLNLRSAGYPELAQVEGIIYSALRRLLCCITRYFLAAPTARQSRSDSEYRGRCQGYEWLCVVMMPTHGSLGVVDSTRMVIRFNSLDRTFQAFELHRPACSQTSCYCPYVMIIMLRLLSRTLKLGKGFRDTGL